MLLLLQVIDSEIEAFDIGEGKVLLFLSTEVFLERIQNSSKQVILGLRSGAHDGGWVYLGIRKSK